MSRKGLILYASHTGNTEKIALRFKQVFEKKGWECDILKVDKNVDVHNPPYHLDDYDFLCVGSPIIQGIPVREIFDDHLGILMPANLIKGRPSEQKGEFGSITEGWGPKKGIVFVTYGGARRGVPEAIPALDCLELRLEDMRVKCVGKFSCCGKERRHSPTMRSIIEKRGWSIEVASATLARYRENPNSPEFDSYTKEERALIDATLGDEGKGAMEVERSHSWHWDFQNRPHERDLLKAEIFLEEILEDYYEGGIEAAPLAQYLCIA